MRPVTSSSIASRPRGWASPAARGTGCRYRPAFPLAASASWTSTPRGLPSSCMPAYRRPMPATNWPCTVPSTAALPGIGWPITRPTRATTGPRCTTPSSAYCPAIPMWSSSPGLGSTGWMHQRARPPWWTAAILTSRNWSSCRIPFRLRVSLNPIGSPAMAECGRCRFTMPPGKSSSPRETTNCAIYNSTPWTAPLPTPTS